MGPGGTLKVAGGNFSGTSWFGFYIDKCQIKTLTLKTDMDVPDNIVNTYDIGVDPGTVTLWIDSSGNATIGTDMSYMFASSKTTTLNLSNFSTSNVTDMSAMFEDMRNLTSLDFRNATQCGGTWCNNEMTESMFGGVKTGATIYTKDNATKTWLQAGYPSGNYIIP